MATFVITGGHHNSALVFAQYAQSQGDQVYWYGHRHASRNNQALSAEYHEVNNAQIPFFDLPAGRATFSLREIFLIPYGWLVAFTLLRRHRPDYIVSFGGYLGAAVGLVGYLLRIPLFIHEQTITAGKANRFLSRFAKRIYLTFPASRRAYPPGKTRLVGLPLRPSILHSSPLQLFRRSRPILLVMGGKQGAHVLNEFIFAHLGTLLKHYNIIHQTGEHSQTRDHERAQTLRHHLPSDLRQSYLTFPYILQAEIGGYLHSADLYFGRSGAHITYELAVLALPAILTPLATTYGGEQCLHADYLARTIGAIHLPEPELSLPRFLAAAQTLRSHRVKPPSLPIRAVETMYHDITQF